MATDDNVLSKQNEKTCDNSMENNQSGNKLSHKQWKKLKRKKKRQAAALLREAEKIEESEDAVSDPEEKLKEEREKEREHQLFLERERLAEQLFLAKKERERKEQEYLEEQQRKIKEEWEEIKKKEEEEREKKERKDKTEKDRQEALLKEATIHENKDVWHNPIAPVVYSSERQVNECPFFKKTGACRYGDSCSRSHLYPDESNTIIIPGMFSHFKLDQILLDEYDTDLSLEYEDKDLYNSFLEFYEDVLPEFKSVGKVTQFKVCSNCNNHLRGNVYVSYASVEDARKALIKFNGRWYAGKQLSCEFRIIEHWKTAICGLLSRNVCPKGNACNFLHVFRNPNREFRNADFDEYKHNGTSRSDRHSSYRHSPHHSSRRHRSRSRSRRSRSTSKHRSRSHRSRSRSKYKSKSKKTSYRSRSRSRKSSRHHSDSRSSRYSHSRLSRSRSRSRSPSLSYSRENLKKSKSRKRSRSRSQSERRSRSVSYGRSRSKSRSNSSTDRRSKKKRKKSKKHKRSRVKSKSKTVSPKSSNSGEDGASEVQCFDNNVTMETNVDVEKGKITLPISDVQSDGQNSLSNSGGDFMKNSIVDENLCLREVLKDKIVCVPVNSDNSCPIINDNNGEDIKIDNNNSPRITDLKDVNEKFSHIESNFNDSMKNNNDDNDLVSGDCVNQNSVDSFKT